jgi:transcriptional regulator of aromatic amino acid metabolism
LFLVITLDREHPAHSFIHNLERNFITYGSFSKRVDNQQRRRSDALGEEFEEQLLTYVRVNPRASTRHVSRELGIYHTAVCISLYSL